MRALIISLVLLSAACTSRALDLFVQLHQYHWEEHNQEDRLLLEEDGPLVGLGLAGSSHVTERMTWSSRLEAFLGEVDYDGSTILGAPVRTTTAYYGGKGETELRWNLAGPDVETGPLGGLSTRGWLRRLDNSQDSNGYDEAWWLLYGRAGWYAGWRPGPDLRLRVEAAVRLPAYNSARYSLAGPEGDGNVSVEPGREVSYEARAELRAATWSLGLTYEDFRISQSEPEPLPPSKSSNPNPKAASSRCNSAWCFERETPARQRRPSAARGRAAFTPF